MIRCFSDFISNSLFSQIFREIWNQTSKKEELKNIMFNVKPLLDSHNEAIQELNQLKKFMKKFLKILFVPIINMPIFELQILQNPNFY
jgi:hypothetical protein